MEKRQTLETLINEEALLFQQVLADRETSQHPQERGQAKAMEA